MRSASWAPRVAALIGGALPVPAFPEPGLWWLAYVALSPTMVLVVRAGDPREAAIRGWLAGSGFMLAMHHWLVPNVGPFAMVLALAFGVLWVPWTLAIRLLRERTVAALLVVPAAFVVGEYARSWQSLGGPWGLLGATQWALRPVLAIASIGGVWLISFLLCAVNVAAAAAFVRRRPRDLVPLLLTFGVLALFAALAPTPEQRGSRRVAVIQPGADLGPRTRFERQLGATRVLRDVDLVVWAESAIAQRTATGGNLRRIARASDGVGADVLVNIDARRGSGGIYKSSVLIGPDGPRATYDKMRLVPFGEYIPLRAALGWLSRFTEAAEEDRRRGAGPVTMRSAGVRIGPLVCFESAFTDMSRSLVRRGADLIVVQSATTTFQQSWAPAQHASLAGVRAVETGRPVVHATLSGESAAFDATGRRLARLSTDRRGTMVVDVPLAAGRTPYVRYGDVAPAASVVLLAGWAALRLLRRRASGS